MPGEDQVAVGRAPQEKAAHQFVWRSPLPRSLDEGGPVNRPVMPMGDGFSNEPTVSHLEKIASRYPDKPAIGVGVLDLTYAQLFMTVANLAQRIAAVVPKGSAVGLLLGNSAWYPIAMLASMSCGRPCVQLNPRDPQPRNAGIAEAARLSAIVSAEAADATGWPANLAWIDVASAFGQSFAPLSQPPEEPVSVDAPAVILFTSGSTGRPKGIVDSQRSLLQRVQQYVDACHINSDDVFLPLSGPATIAGCREIMSALLTGATLHLADVEAVGLRQIRRQLQAFRVTILYVVPTLLRALAPQDSAIHFPALRVVRKPRPPERNGSCRSNILNREHQCRSVTCFPALSSLSSMNADARRSTEKQANCW